MAHEDPNKLLHRDCNQPTLSSRARLLVDGAIHQGRCEGYGLVVRRTDDGYFVDGAFCFSAQNAERTIVRLLTARADASSDAAPERRYRPHPGDVDARVVAGVQL